MSSKPLQDAIPRATEAGPDFLIIGSMKAGTTTLYRDLLAHPNIYLPEEKEPDTLTRNTIDQHRILTEYRSLFRWARSTQLRGEASTSYTKRPDYEGVASIARRTCGAGLKLIHISRDPIRQIISHYNHDFGLGYVNETLVQAVERYPRYVAYCNYDWQLDPWYAAFPHENILRLSFEDYIMDRQAGSRVVFRFLGLDPDLAQPPELSRAFNQSHAKPIAQGATLKLLESKMYQRAIKPFIPWRIRDRIMHALLPKAPVGDDSLTLGQIAQIERRIAAWPGEPE